MVLESLAEDVAGHPGISDQGVMMVTQPGHDLHSWKMAIEIVDLSIEMVISHSHVTLQEGTAGLL